MRQFWVVGGEYESTAFKKLASGTSEVRQGPFTDYDLALKEWQRLAWETVDDCNAHFHIEEEDVTASGAGTFWVIGGTYKDASFKEWSGVPERFGPYSSYEAAEQKWQEMAWSTVDDATAQYRIETIQPTVTEEAKAKLAYRFITGPDTNEFCERVSKALEDGYILYGDPSLTTTDGKTICGQAVVLRDN